MGTEPTKAADNVYCQHRKKAAKYNDKLKSRDGAADEIGVSPSTLADYELGNTKVVPVDKVNIMSEVYNAPELREWYCSTQCPLGAGKKQINVKEGSLAVLGMLDAMSKSKSIEDKLKRIFSDGKLTPDEIPKLKKTLLKVTEIVTHGQELLLWAEKNLKDM